MLVSLTKQRQKKQDISILVGLLICFYMLYLWMLYTQLQTEQNLVQKLQYTVQQAQEIRHNLKQTRQAQGLIAKQIENEGYLNLPKAYDRYLAAKLEHVIKPLDLSLLGLHWQPPADFPYHQRLALEIHMQSTFHALGFFIEKILSLGVLARIESLNISRSSSSAYLTSKIHIHFFHLKKI